MGLLLASVQCITCPSNSPCSISGNSKFYSVGTQSCFPHVFCSLQQWISSVPLLLQPNLITLLCYQLVEFVHSTSNLIQGQKADEGNDMEEAPVPGEHLGKRRILVKCKSLTLRLTAQNSTGQLTHVSRKVMGFCRQASNLSATSSHLLPLIPIFLLSAGGALLCLSSSV